MTVRMHKVCTCAAWQHHTLPCLCYHGILACLCICRAIEFNKPIIIIVETDSRFFAWDHDNWKSDFTQGFTQSLRSASNRLNGGPSQATEGVGWLQNTFADIVDKHPKVVELIETHLAAGSMIPYRRREFEAHAMVREFVRRASTPSLWGAVMPRRHESLLPITSSLWGTVMPRARAEHDANLEADRKLRIIADTATTTVDALVTELSEVLLSLSPTLTLESNIEGASHVLVVLSGCLLEQGSTVEAEFRQAVHRKFPFVFLYSSDCGWDFQRFYSTPDSEAKVQIANHEALVFRPARQPHEQRAMALELLRRMRPANPDLPVGGDPDVTLRGERSLTFF